MKVLHRSLTLLGRLIVWLCPAVLSAQEGTVYELLSGSVIRDECEFCDRIPIERALTGTFGLTVLPAGIGVISCAISDLDLRSTDDPSSYMVRGSGSYEAQEEKTQEMHLEVEVNKIAGIILEGAALEIPAPWPFIDLVVTEPRPYRDPNHIFTIRVRAAPAAKMVSCELGKESEFVDDCIPCMRPTIPIPISGTFSLGVVEEGILHTLYRVDAISFTDRAGDAGLKIEGSGWYRVGGEVAVVENMTLELTVTENDAQYRGAILASGSDVGPAQDVTLPHQNPESESHVFSLHMVWVDAPVVQFRRGDANGDGSVDLSDAVAVLVWLFAGGAEPGCLDAGDAAQDGTIDLSDAVGILTYLFLGGEAPPAPGPTDCGPSTDPSAGCAASQC
jgi:hypothetical protein